MRAWERGNGELEDSTAGLLERQSAEGMIDTLYLPCSQGSVYIVPFMKFSRSILPILLFPCIPALAQEDWPIPGYYEYVDCCDFYKLNSTAGIDSIGYMDVPGCVQFIPEHLISKAVAISASEADLEFVDVCNSPHLRSLIVDGALCNSINCINRLQQLKFSAEPSSSWIYDHILDSLHTLELFGIEATASEDWVSWISEQKNLDYLTVQGDLDEGDIEQLLQIETLHTLKVYPSYLFNDNLFNEVRLIWTSSSLMHLALGLHWEAFVQYNWSDQFPHLTSLEIHTDSIDFSQLDSNRMMGVTEIHITHINSRNLSELDILGLRSESHNFMNQSGIQVYLSFLQ